MLLLLVLASLTALVAGWLIWRHYSEDLPDIAAIDDYRPLQTTRIFSSGGDLLAMWTDDQLVHRTVVDFDTIPQVMRDAMLAAEDAEFYSHPGLDYRGLVRATIRNLEAGDTVQGASTITQQLVKNLILTPERTYRRKMQELLLAFRLEERLSKDEILTLYLNEVFFGRTAYGVQAAAEYYFGRSIDTVSLPEAALLAGLVQSPNRYNPYFHPERALARRSYVLRQMWEKGFIEESVWREAEGAPLALAGPEDRPAHLGRHPWVVDTVRRELHALASEVPGLSDLNLLASGLHIHTTVDVEEQLAAVEALRLGLSEFDARRGFHRPWRTFPSEEQALRFGSEHHASVRRDGLDSASEYRGVITSSDDESTRMLIGGIEVTLDRTPERRMRPDPARDWSEQLPPHAAFTVQPLRSWTPEALAESEPGSVRVRFLPSAEAALVALDPQTRAIRAIVGGFDHTESSFNRAIQARRQTGSAFKTFVFAAALQTRAITLASVFVDQPFTHAMDVGPDWRPRNHDGRYEGEMSARTALARSRNTVTAQILRQVGVESTQQLARDAGIDSRLPDGLALALGAAEMSPLELTNAYATFASGGTWARPGIIERIEGPEGEVLYERDASPEQRISPDLAWLVTSMLRSVVTEGTGARAGQLGFETVGKTGTTNNTRDAWYVGYSSSLVVGVWAGRDSDETLGRGEGGSRTALPIWVHFLATVINADASPPFPGPPAGVRTLRVDPATGLRAAAGATRSREEYFLEGTEPVEVAPREDERTVEDTILRGRVFGFEDETDDEEDTSRQHEF